MATVVRVRAAAEDSGLEIKRRFSHKSMRRLSALAPRVRTDARQTTIRKLISNGLVLFTTGTGDECHHPVNYNLRGLHASEQVCMQQHELDTRSVWRDGTQELYSI